MEAWVRLNNLYLNLKIVRENTLCLEKTPTCIFLDIFEENF